MIEQIDKVRLHAGRRGLHLREVDGRRANGTELPLYQLTVQGQDCRIFPQGAGVEGAPLHEVEDWLSCPWE